MPNNASKPAARPTSRSISRSPSRPRAGAARAPQRTSAIEWSDLELLDRVLGRDEHAWAELVRRYRALIYRCITKVTGKYAPGLGAADLDEIYAEVLLGLFRDDMRKLRMYDPQRGTKLGSWIGMISVNAAYDHLRGIGRRPILDRIDGAPETHEETERSPLELLLEKERWAHFNGLLGDFSSKDRTFLELYYARGLEAADVANHMAISLKTVYSKKHKIRAHLQRSLAAHPGSVLADLASADLAAAA